MSLQTGKFDPVLFNFEYHLGIWRKYLSQCLSPLCPAVFEIPDLEYVLNIVECVPLATASNTMAWEQMKVKSSTRARFKTIIMRWE